MLRVRSAALARLGVTLRAETDEDLDWLRALYAAARAAELAQLPWPEQAKTLFLADQFRLQRCHVLTRHPDADRLVVLAGRRSAGATAIGRLYVDRSAQPWRIIDIALLPDAQRRGIGAALIGGLQAMATPNGIDLHVARDNPRAARLYARLGFADAFTTSATHRRMVWTG